MSGDRVWRQGFCFVFLLWLTFCLEDRLGPVEVMHTVTLNLSSVFQRHGSRNVFAGAARLSCLQGGRLGRSIASRFIWPYFWSLRTMRWCKAVILPCVCGWCKTKLLYSLALKSTSTLFIWNTQQMKRTSDYTQDISWNLLNNERFK